MSERHSDPHESPVEKPSAQVIAFWDESDYATFAVSCHEHLLPHGDGDLLRLRLSALREFDHQFTVHMASINVTGFNGPSRCDSRAFPVTFGFDLPFRAYVHLDLLRLRFGLFGQ